LKGEIDAERPLVFAQQRPDVLDVLGGGRGHDGQHRGDDTAGSR
jgi:hypothetical protein